MFKRTLTPIFCLLCIFTTNAQETVEKTPMPIDHEIGINTTYLFKQLISLSDSTIATSPYLITYKLYLNDKIGIRVGLGGKYKYTEEKAEGFDDSIKDTDSAFDYRIGVEWKKHLGKRWTGILGIDFIGKSSLDQTLVDTGFDVVTFETKSSGYGGGLAVGIYYHFTKNIGLYTEGAVSFISSKSGESQDFKNFPEFNNKTDQLTGRDFAFSLPTTLYFVINF